MVNIGEILIQRGKLTSSEVIKITNFQQVNNLRFGESAIALGILNEQDIISALNTQFEHPVVEMGKSKIDPNLIAAYQCTGAEVESFRTLRSQLMLRWFEKEKKSLLIAGDSCSSAKIAAGLAVLFSQMGQRTLLIDADLRSGNLHEIFGLDSVKGLSDYLVGRIGHEEAIFNIEGLKALDLIPAGTQVNNHQELLMRDSFKIAIKKLEAIYDVIVVNGHQLNLASDSQMLASWIGGILVVTKSGESTFTQLKKIKTDMELSGTILIGSVMI